MSTIQLSTRDHEGLVRGKEEGRQSNEAIDQIKIARLEDKT